MASNILFQVVRENYIFLALLLLIPNLKCAGNASERPPNIIFIMADDLGYGEVGVYGQRHIKTPYLDQMATEGMRFTQSYSGAPVCAPARDVLMTGRHTGHTQIRHNSAKVGGQLEAFGEGNRRVSLNDNVTTVAEVLRQAGYVTGITGKWGLGEPGTDGMPNRQGFDQWLGYLNQNHAPYYYTEYLWHNEEQMILHENLGSREGVYTHDLFTEFAVDFIRAHREEPFFLYIPYTIPHVRLEVPDTSQYADKPWPEEARIYASMVSRMDRDIGRILAVLRNLQIDGNTLVFFCSDNGHMEEGAGDWADLFDSNGPLRGAKKSLHEGGIRVPMIAWWPGRIPAGSVNDAVWYFADFLPTAAELAGAAELPAHDGTSIVETLFDPGQELEDRFLYWEGYGNGFQQAARWRDWKAIKKGADQPVELYNLTNDLGEKNNVADQFPGIAAKMEEFMKRSHTESPHWPVTGLQ